MQSIGQKLKTERQHRKMTIADVVAATKMTTAVIEAIEADNFSSLAAPIYARGFIKLYAECLALDPAALLKQFGASSARSPETLAALAKASLLKVPPAAAEKKESAPETAPEAAQGATKVAAKRIDRAVLPPAAAPFFQRLITALAFRRAWQWLAQLVSKLVIDSLAALRAWHWPKFNWKLFSLSVRPWPQLSWKLFSPSARSWLRIPQAVNWRVPLPVGMKRLLLNMAAAILLVIAAVLIWGLCRRGQPTLTNECRWAAEPPAPYLDLEPQPAKFPR